MMPWGGGLVGAGAPSTQAMMRSIWSLAVDPGAIIFPPIRDAGFPAFSSSGQATSINKLGLEHERSLEAMLVKVHSSALQYKTSLLVTNAM